MMRVKATPSHDRHCLLDCLNLLSISARRLVKLERRMKVANALAFTKNNAICICESGLKKIIESSELHMDNSSLYRLERSSEGETYLQGNVMLAVRNTIPSELLRTSPPDYSSTCKHVIRVCEA